MTTDTRVRDHADVPAPARPPQRRLSVVGILGELFIAAGVLIALFVVWQLFYTDVQGERVQREAVEETEWVQPAIVAADIVETIPDELKMRDTDPPEMRYPDFAEKLAALMVPRWGEDYTKMIYEGVTRADVLDPLGIGHYPDTALPGQTGNFAISAHRTTYGKPFVDIDQLAVGDALIVQTGDAWFVYTVESWDIVTPQDVQVIAPMPGEPGVEADDRYITLTTCHPKFSAAERWVVHGRLDYWAPTGNGVPEELLVAAP
ncbi:class E sortase [Demequina aestuarii]|uniref:class E sortase n=1 Tax=Demequina aestuarii TaxID=327095 RepID=UPI00078498FA|nr:class E sortase [Demequina aestuarii]